MPDVYPANEYILTKLLTDLAPEIRREFRRVEAWFPTRSYRDLFKGQNLDVNQRWRSIPLMKRDRVCWYSSWLFPCTSRLIKTVPVYENLMFSMFPPGCEFEPHQGWSDHFVRVHLGIDCNDHSCLVVNDQHIKEQDNKVIMFDDSQWHWAYNRGSTTRTVLLFDILKKDLEKLKL